MSNKLTPMIIEVTPVSERIVRRRIRHSLGVISLDAVIFAETLNIILGALEVLIEE